MITCPYFPKQGQQNKNINTFSEWFDVIITFNQTTLFMLSKKIIENILNKCCEISELSKEQVLRSREENARTARKTLIEVLTEYFTDTEIARVLGVKRQRVNAIRNNKTNKNKTFSERILYRDLSTYAKETINET